MPKYMLYGEVKRIDKVVITTTEPVGENLLRELAVRYLDSGICCQTVTKGEVELDEILEDVKGIPNGSIEKIECEEGVDYADQSAEFIGTIK